MSFDGTEGGSITLSSASDLTAEYRRLNPGAAKAHFFGKDILLDLLDQTGCKGIRMYYGIDENGDKELVLVGADSNQDDISTGIIADLSVPCPNECSAKNDLNS
jgi:hypothetical protein